MLYKFMVKSESVITKGKIITNTVIVASKNLASAKKTIVKHTPGKIKKLELIGRKSGI